MLFLLKFLRLFVPVCISCTLSTMFLSDYYDINSAMFLFLTAINIILCLFFTQNARHVWKLMFCATPVFLFTCLFFNLFITLIFISAAAVVLIFMPVPYENNRILFTHDNQAVFVRYNLPSRRQMFCKRLSYVMFTGLCVILLLMLSFDTVPHGIWGYHGFPVDLSEKPVYAEKAVASGEVTFSAGYDTSAIIIDSFFDIETENGTFPSPALTAGVQKGDIVTHINSQRATESDFIKKSLFENSISVDILRYKDKAYEELSFVIEPIYSQADEKYLIGITYFEQSVCLYTTLQTMTFTYPESGYFAATAHAYDTGKEYLTHILSSATVTGRDDGGLTADAGSVVGRIDTINNYGAFGTWYKFGDKLMPIAKKSELRYGKATLLSSFEGEVKEYDVQLCGTYRIDGRDVICLLASDSRIVDAGGIARGMSGSPIIQNGKIIGALSNTTEGGYLAYATFAYDMAHEIYLMDKNKQAVK